MDDEYGHDHTVAKHKQHPIARCGRQPFLSPRPLHRPQILQRREPLPQAVIAGSNANSRQKRIRRFQEQEGFGEIILSPLAVGFRVNIWAPNHAIHFSRTWNPAKEDQATDRAYRIGQTRDVHVHYPIVSTSAFTTFDEELHELLTWKLTLSKDILNGSGELCMDDFGGLEAPAGSAA